MKCPARHAIRGSLVARCDVTRPHRTHHDRQLNVRWGQPKPAPVPAPAVVVTFPEPERPACDACGRNPDGTMVSFEVAGEARATFHHRCAPLDLAFEDFLRAQHLPDAPPVSSLADDAAPSDTSGPVPDGATSGGAA